jgi:hypothetical protein
MSNGIIGIPKKKIKFMVSTAYIYVLKNSTLGAAKLPNLQLKKVGPENS